MGQSPMSGRPCPECGIRKIGPRQQLCNPCYKRLKRAEGAAWVARDRAASRAWKATHPEQSRALSYDECACGRGKGRRYDQCQTCWREQEQARISERDHRVERWWAEGLPMLEIAARLGWSMNHLRTEFWRMRNRGCDLPFRRPRRKVAA